MTELLVNDFQILPPSIKPSRRTPWGIQLSSGQRCGISPGANSSVEGVGILWGCTSELVLLADLDTSTSLWTITAVRYDAEAGTYTSLGRQTISRVWFGRRARTP